MAPSLSLHLSTFSFSSLNHSCKMRLNCQRASFSFFPFSSGGKHEFVAYLAHSYLQLETRFMFLYFLPRRSLKSPAEYACIHLEVRKARYQCWHKGPVTGSGIGRGWAAWPCWILGLHYAFMFSLRCCVLSPGQLGHIFNGPFGWKTV